MCPDARKLGRSSSASSIIAAYFEHREHGCMESTGTWLSCFQRFTINRTCGSCFKMAIDALIAKVVAAQTSNRVDRDLVTQDTSKLLKGMFLSIVSYDEATNVHCQLSGSGL